MLHLEIVSQLRKIVQIHKDFKKFESKVGRASEYKAAMPFDVYLQQLIRFDTENGGTIRNDIYGVTTRLESAKPDFRTIGLSTGRLQHFSTVTEGRSQRMEDQLLLSKLLEVKDIFKTETDIFKPQNITRVESLLKEMK